MAKEHRDVPDEHYAAIGKIAASWAIFEMLLDSSMTALAEIDDKEKAVCFTSQIARSARKLDAITALLRLSPEGLSKVKQINKIAETTRALAERRNRVVHDIWLQEGDKLLRLEATARKILKFGPFHVDPSDMDKLQADIWAHIVDYVRLMHLYLRGKRTSQEKPAGDRK